LLLYNSLCQLFMFICHQEVIMFFLKHLYKTIVSCYLIFILMSLQLYSGREHLKATGLQTRKGDLSTRDLGFIYVSSAGQVGCEFLHPAQPTNAPSSRRSSRSHFYTPG
jgi:hypothetical protein